MTPERQRIATACHWKPEGGDYGRDSLPDYVNDLNAIHKAVLQRDDDFKNRFEWTLNGIAIEQDKYLVEMSAKDWSAAFLKTLDLMS